MQGNQTSITKASKTGKNLSLFATTSHESYVDTSSGTQKPVSQKDIVGTSEQLLKVNEKEGFENHFGGDIVWRNILKTSSVRPSIVTDKRLLKSTKSIKFEDKMKGQDFKDLTTIRGFIKNSL